MAGGGFIGNLTNLAGNQTGEIVRSSFGLLTNIPGMDVVVRLFQIAGALAILYFIFLIIKTIAGWKSAARLKVVAQNIIEINKKMDILISHISVKESKATKSKK